MPKDFPTAKGTRIIRALLNTEGLTIPELVAKDETLNINSAGSALTALEADGYVKRQNTQGQGRAYLWVNTAVGRSMAQLAIELEIGG